MRAGADCRAVDAVARDLIDAAGHEEHFGHGLGHGVGLEVHEGPRLTKKSEDGELQAGNVVSVEPGVYLPGRAWACGSRTSWRSQPTARMCSRRSRSHW